jgi:putative heme utilization radical SAM enzyme HutW
MRPAPDFPNHPTIQQQDDALRHAFPTRRPHIPWKHRHPVEAGDIPTIWQNLINTPAHHDHPRLLYVHVPFCANHCLFCGFYRYKHREERAANYTRLLIEEIINFAVNSRARSAPIHAVYLGGGTPSALTATELHQILSAIHTHYPLASDCEVTVEGRIIHFDDDKVDACLEAGANRFSIGVQSFDTEVRRSVGRRSSREQTIHFLERLIARNRAAIVVDLIFGLPRQSLEIWSRDLDTCLDIAPDGVDLYALNVFHGTPLQEAIARGTFPAALPLSELGPMYASGVERFDRAGWSQLSNSHFARSIRERNRYNLLIKEGAETLAFGSGAGGTMGIYSFVRSGDLDAWSNAVQASCLSLGSLMQADPQESIRTTISAALERGQLAISDLAPHLSETLIINTILPELRDWCRRGLAFYQNNTIQLTTAGRFWSSNLVGALTDRIQLREHHAHQ